MQVVVEVAETILVQQVEPVEVEPVEERTVALQPALQIPVVAVEVMVDHRLTDQLVVPAS
jgi:hypothetical protein